MATPTSPGEDPNSEMESTPEIDEGSRLKLGLPLPLVERLYVAGMLWSLKEKVKEIEASTGKAPSALEALTWAEEELRKIRGRGV